MKPTSPSRTIGQLLAATALAALFGASPAGARPTPIRIVDAVCPAPPNGARTAEGEFTILNSGGADRLIAVASPAAARTQLHTMEMTGGVMHMAPIQGGLAIAPKGRTRIGADAGRHLMFIDLKSPFRVGARTPFTLTFAHAGTVKAACIVKPRG